MIPATSRQLSNSAHDRLSIEILDESRRPEDCRIDLDPRQAGLHLLQRLLHPTGDGERVAPGKLFDDEHEAWAVVDDGIADHALRRIDEIGHVAQQQRRLAGRVGHRHPGQRLRCNAGRRRSGAESADWVFRRSRRYRYARRGHSAADQHRGHPKPPPAPGRA